MSVQITWGHSASAAFRITNIERRRMTQFFVILYVPSTFPATILYIATLYPILLNEKPILSTHRTPHITQSFFNTTNIERCTMIRLSRALQFSMWFRHSLTNVLYFIYLRVQNINKFSTVGNYNYPKTMVDKLHKENMLCYFTRY